jgi:guanylate kinase
MFWNIFKKHRGLFFIISSPSGGGKSTIIEKTMQRLPMLEKPVSYTTREPRGTEKNGIDYHFISKNAFLAMKERGEFIEWAEVHNNFYATSLKNITEAINSNKYLIKDIDTQGALNLKKILGKNAVLIFIKPPSMEELKKRLQDRQTDTGQTIELRLKNAEEEIKKAVLYQHIAVNDVLDRTVSEVTKIINGYINNAG